MSVLKFIEQCNTGATGDWIMMCGLSSAGKSHFMDTHSLHYAKNAVGGSDIFLPIRDKHFKHLGIHHHWALTSHPNEWSTDWLELYNSKNFTIKKKGIIIGVPYSTWLKRCEMRGFCPHEASSCTPLAAFKQAYEKIFKRLDNNDIPYISVDSRDNYPILDKSSFLEILQG